MKNEMEKTAPENQQLSLPQNEALQLYSTASTLQLTKEESTALILAFDDSIVEIRPDGHIYIPQSYYRNRLNEVVGIGQWGLIPKGQHQEVNGGKTKLFLNGVLMIRNCFVSEAVGEAELFGDNPNQSIASCWESAKSDCITRCCKDLSIAKQIYEPAYVRLWQAQYAIAVWVNGKQKPQWRKKDALPFLNENGPVKGFENTDKKGPFPFQHPDQNKPWLNKETRNGGVTGDWLRITKAIADKAITLDEIMHQFKVNPTTRTEIDLLFQEAYAGKNPKIEGKWYAILEKCKYKQDVNEAYTKHQAEVDANQDLLMLFRETKTGLPHKLKSA